MTLPWFLNPWAEVRRLRAELKWRDHMRLDMAKAWRDERRENYQRIREANVLKDENADLRRWIAENDAHGFDEGNGRFASISPDLLQELEAAAKRTMTAEEIETQRQNYARSLGRSEL